MVLQDFTLQSLVLLWGQTKGTGKDMVILFTVFATIPHKLPHTYVSPH